MKKLEIWIVFGCFSNVGRVNVREQLNVFPKSTDITIKSTSVSKFIRSEEQFLIRKQLLDPMHKFLNKQY